MLLMEIDPALQDLLRMAPEAVVLQLNPPLRLAAVVMVLS